MTTDEQRVRLLQLERAGYGNPAARDLAQRMLRQRPRAVVYVTCKQRRKDKTRELVGACLAIVLCLAAACWLYGAV